MAVTHPELLWAQRSSDSDPERNIIYLTIAAPELDSDFDLKVSDGNKLSFHGKSRAVSSKGTAADLDAKEFQFEYELFGDVEEVRRGLTGKGVQVVLRKKDLSDEYWPRLLKEKGKNSRITTDWSKWVDEDEQDAEAVDDDFGAGGMPDMGGMGGGGMPGMGAGGPGGMDFASMMGGAGGAGGMDFASMMGGAGGAGGAGGMDFAKMMEQMKAAGVGGPEGAEGEGEADSSDDEGPPPLEQA
ncbi:HSP20-like chaperone [Rhodotorula sp. JG-1b]|nr:HSP20-like chaperone [Rhodotorula sp. JG-1b]